ncbi:unnamed protein product [Cunninghamella echinulata]
MTEKAINNNNKDSTQSKNNERKTTTPLNNNEETNSSVTNTKSNSTLNKTINSKASQIKNTMIQLTMLTIGSSNMSGYYGGSFYDVLRYICITKHLDRKLDCPICRVSLSRDQIFPNFQLNKIAEQRLKFNPTSVTYIDPDPINIEQYFDKLPYNELISMLSSAVAKQEKAKVQKKDVQRSLLSIFLNLLEQHNLKLVDNLEQELDMIRHDIHSIGSTTLDIITKKGIISSSHQDSSDNCHNHEKEPSNEFIASKEPRKRKLIFDENDSSSTKYQKLNDKNETTSSTLTSRKQLIEQRFDDLCELYFIDRQESSINGLDKFSSKLYELTQYTSFKELDTIYYTDISVNSAIVSSIEFDRDEDYIAVGGVTKDIKMFDFNMMNTDTDEQSQTLNDHSINSDDSSSSTPSSSQPIQENNTLSGGGFIGKRRPMSFVHCPIRVMQCDHKISCLSWNPYIKSSIASSDYEGIINLWDVNSGQVVRSYEEHRRRAWSIDTSKSNPTLLASGSDDSTVKIWSIHTRKSVHTLEQRGNVCCAKFAPNNNYHVAIGSVDHQVSCYDLRSPKTPFKTFNGHNKAVSYVKWINDQEIVSASTDNSLKLWHLNKDECEKTFSGHQNEKNFVGLSVKDDWIACGSESNTVYTYHKNSRYPVAQYRFPVINPISGQKTFEEDPSLFVSSVCWKNDNTMKMVVANSKGMIKVLRLEE